MMVKMTKHQGMTTILLLGMVFLFSCTTTPSRETFHYTLDYLDYTEDPALVRVEPLPYQVWVNTMEIPRTYSRRQIAIRHFGPKISFAENDLWAGRLEDYFPRIMGQRLQRYRSFQSVSTDLLSSRPELEVTMSLYRMELFQSNDLSEAHLALDFNLRRSGDLENIVTYSFTRTRRLYSGAIELYVQAINELFLEAVDGFVQRVYGHYDRGPEAEASPGETEPESAGLVEAEPGYGLLFLPTLSGIRGLGNYRVYDNNDEEFLGEYGADLPLPEGTYRLEYGSGTREMAQVKSGVVVRVGQRTIVEPDWGALTVDIVDERGEHLEVIYEVFDSSTGISYGSEYPAREALGDPPRVWHLAPGLYKVTVNNQPFNASRDFTTIQVEAGRWRRLTIVGESEDDLFQGMIAAGILDEEEFWNVQGNWAYTSAIHGSINLDAQHPENLDSLLYSLDLNTQWDNQVRYQESPFSFMLNHVWELGLGLGSNEDLLVNRDLFSVRSSGVVDLLGGLGLYARLDANTHIFPRNRLFSDPMNLSLLDADGQLRETLNSVEQLQVQVPLFPLVLKEGLGINFRLLNRARASLTFRSGFGLQQDFNNNALREVSPTVFQDVPDSTSMGLEVSALALVQPLPNLLINSNADILFPFLEGDSILFNWEVGMNLTLFRYLSLNYKMVMEKDSNYVDWRFNFDHRLLLRLTYLIR